MRSGKSDLEFLWRADWPGNGWALFWRDPS